MTSCCYSKSENSWHLAALNLHSFYSRHVSIFFSISEDKNNNRQCLLSTFCLPRSDPHTLHITNFIFIKSLFWSYCYFHFMDEETEAEFCDLPKVLLIKETAESQTQTYRAHKDPTLCKNETKQKARC